MEEQERRGRVKDGGIRKKCGLVRENEGGGKLAPSETGKSGRDLSKRVIESKALLKSFDGQPAAVCNIFNRNV